MPANRVGIRGRERWTILGLAVLVGLLLGLAACGSRPNRLEVLRHQRQVLSFRADKDRFFKDSPQSPLFNEQQWAFHALNYFPVDIAYRVTARYRHLTSPAQFKIKTSNGHERVYLTVGQLDFTLLGQTLTLFAYREDSPEGRARNELFVPFTDKTNGRETYGGGRYLDIEEPKGDKLVLDFNYAYNPYCAYNHNFSCPIPPPENHLGVAVRAGERLFAPPTPDGEELPHRAE